MTDRHIGYVVTLEGSVREDDAQAIVNAIKMVKGVIGVEPVVENIGTMMAEERARHAIERRLWAALNPEKQA